jgi:hypothetical protein
MKPFLLRGSVFLQLVSSTGVTIGGVHGPINAEEISVEPDSEQIIVSSTNKETYGKSLGSITESKPTKISLKFSDVSSDILAAALGAKSEVLNVGAAAETDKTFTLFSDGKWTDIGHKQIVATGFVVKKSAAVQTLGDDYEINYAAGLIRPNPSGNLKDGGAVEITFTALARDGARLIGGKVQQANWRITMNGENAFTGDNVDLDIPFATLTSKTKLNLVQNEVLSPEFEGVANVAQGKDYDYSLDVADPPA